MPHALRVGLCQGLWVWALGRQHLVQSEGVGHPAGCRRKGPHLGCWSRGWGGGGKASVPEQVRVRPRPPGSTAAVLTRAPMCPRAHAPAPGPADAALSARGVCRRDEGRRGHARAGRALHPVTSVCLRRGQGLRHWEGGRVQTGGAGVWGSPAAGEAGGALPGGFRGAWPQGSWISGFWPQGLCEEQFVLSEATRFVAFCYHSPAGQCPNSAYLGAEVTRGPLRRAGAVGAGCRSCSCLDAGGPRWEACAYRGPGLPTAHRDSTGVALGACAEPRFSGALGRRFVGRGASPWS